VPGSTGLLLNTTENQNGIYSQSGTVFSTGMNREV
jgi:hypothetical protein